MGTTKQASDNPCAQTDAHGPTTSPISTHTGAHVHQMTTHANPGIMPYKGLAGTQRAPHHMLCSVHPTQRTRATSVHAPRPDDPRTF